MGLPPPGVGFFTLGHNKTKMNWPDAQQACQEWGGHLVSIRSAEEQAQVAGFIQTQEPTWTGGNDLLEEGAFTWTDGTPFSYTNWHEDEPNNAGGREDCVAMWGANEWNDWFCSSTAWYACEKRESTLEAEAAQLEWENKMNASAVDDI